MSGWVDGFAHWTEGDTAYLSIVFSWKLPLAYQKAVWYRAQGYQVRAGGPALLANRNYLSDVADLGGDIDALTHHNPGATIASRGCPVGCWFCVVPKLEGRTFTLLPDFTPRPILCDNNLSALPVEYQEHIIRRYQESGVLLSDANSGFEPHAFDDDTFQRWRGILDQTGPGKKDPGPWRFAFDEMGEAAEVEAMMRLLKDEPARRKRVYVLIGNEPMAACHERIRKVIEWGGEPHCQPVMSLRTLEKRPIIRHDWTEQKLIDMARWANRYVWRYAPLAEYRPRVDGLAPFAAVAL